MTDPAIYIMAIGSLFLFFLLLLSNVFATKDYESEILKERVATFSRRSNSERKNTFFHRLTRRISQTFKKVLRGNSANRSLATVEKLIPLYQKKSHLIIGTEQPTQFLLIIWTAYELILTAVILILTIVLIVNLPVLRIDLLYIALIPSVILFIPYVLLSNRKKKRNAEIEANWHYVIDALLLGVESGQPVTSSLQAVTLEVSNQSIHLKNFLTKLVAELTLRDDGYMVFQDYMKRTDSRFVRDTFQILAASIARGTSVVTSLRSLRKNFMTRRRLVYQEAANKIATKMTLPLVVFFIPVQFVIIGLPLAIQFLEN